MLLQLEKICKSYTLGETHAQALKDISIAIDEHEFICLRGLSGSGKSTLLHIMGLLTPPTSGIITFESRKVPLQNHTFCDGIRAQRIGFVFQQFHLLPMLTALENVMLGLKIGGVGKPRIRARESLAQVGLADKLHRYPTQLSGGEQQRVAFARAIAKTPLLLIADEPTANLDSENAAQLITLMQHLHENSNTTVICASHTPSLINVAHRIIELQDGAIISDSAQCS